MNQRKTQPSAVTPLFSLIRRNIHLLSCRKCDHVIISSSFPETSGETEIHDSNINEEYEREKTMVKLSATNSLSVSSRSSVLEEEEQEHCSIDHSRRQSSYTLQMSDPYDLQRESRDDEHTEEKLEEDQWEWSMSGMSTIEKDWKDISSLSFRNKTTAERQVKLHSEVSVYDLSKRANTILGLLLQRDTSILPQDHTFPTSSTTLPRPFLIRNDSSGYSDELSDENDTSSQGDNDDLSVDDDISTISPLTFATAYTSVSVITKASILDLKMKKRLLEQKIERGFHRARCSTIMPSSVEFIGYLPSNDRPLSSMDESRTKAMA